MHARAHAHAHTYTHTHTHTHTHMNTHMHTFTCARTRTHIYIAGVTLMNIIMYHYIIMLITRYNWQCYMHLEVLTFSSGFTIAEILLHKCSYNLERICSLLSKSIKK